MRYSGLILNDITAAPGLCVSFFTQGCPHHCPGCHNPDTWAFEGGKQFTAGTLNEIITGLTAQGIQRDLCIMGGEPLCEDNAFLTHMVIQEVRKKVLGVKVYIWSGYVYEDLLKSTNPHVRGALELADVLIDGPYIAAERDLTLNMRGSRNQRVIDLHKKK
jgi:anaerobic ribonucleoside-triphosphate reductase activating protein